MITDLRAIRSHLVSAAPYVTLRIQELSSLCMLRVIYAPAGITRRLSGYVFRATAT
jgi:hypothetical protein